MAAITEEIKKQLECLLFVAYEPMSEKRLSDILEIDISLVRQFITELQDEYQDRGFHLQQIAGGWQFMTPPEFAPVIERLYRPKTQALSRAALETLAIIAYRQPVTRLEMEQIRQIKVDGVVNTLLDKNLIKEVGRREGPGRPILYGTTKEFLDKFGLKSLSELPPLESFVQDSDDNSQLLFAEKSTPEENFEKGKLFD